MVFDRKTYISNYNKNNYNKKKEYNKQWYHSNKEKVKEWVNQYCEKNKDKIKIYHNEYYLNNKEKFKNNFIKNFNKEKHNLYSNKSYHKNKGKNKHIQAWRNILKRTLQYQNIKKESTTLYLLGYNSEKLKQRIEFQFTLEMSWENYGSYWEIDHIKPVSKFPPSTPPNIVNSLCNLKPLLVSENRKKSNKF